ncbi:MAG: ribosome assembly cofactor RimP [Bacteroidales bacterium]|nr:ribosome assembly cofactor RimP [Bacteroidales bacterium]
MKLIKAEHIKSIINEELEKNNLFLIDINVSRLNKISVIVDSLKGVTIEECEKLSRLIEKNLDRDEVDFELEVSSPGIDRPLSFPFQYRKNIGREVEVIKTDGEKIKGTLTDAGEDNFSIEIKSKRKKLKEQNKKTIQYKKRNFLILVTSKQPK